MPSFASSLSLGRGGKSDGSSASSPLPAPAPIPHPRPAKAKSHSFFAKAPKTPVETTVSILSRPALTPGSSCSSDGSAGLPTPEDDALMPPFPKSEERKRWSSWFARRKQSERENVAVPELPPKDDRSPPQILADAKKKGDGRAALRRASPLSASDSDEDGDSASGSSRSHKMSSAMVPRPVSSRPKTMAQARSNMRTLLRNTLNRPPSSPPLVETPSSFFPRSSASLGSTQHAISLEAMMHVRKMLWRLEHQTLSDSEVDSILNLAQRPRPKEAAQTRTEKRSLDDIIAYATMRVGRYSRGLRKWALRPNFEQRFLAWIPNEKGEVACRSIMGVRRGLAVCELEFSEGIEALAGLELDDETFERSVFPPVPPPKKLSSRQTTRTQLPSPGCTGKLSFHRSPSSLRVDHSAPAEPIVSTVSPLSSAVSSKPASGSILDVKSPDATRGSAIAKPAGSRSTLDDAELDESVPLGYALQAKKRREEKARFLQAERDRREKELAAIEKQKREIEQRRALEEQRRKEEERKRIDEDKRAREEKVKEKYNEEITAARQRRESARLGLDNYMNIREMNYTDNRRTYSRPAYDTAPPPVQLPRRSQSAVAVAGEGLGKISLNDPRPSSIAESSGDRRRRVVPSSFNVGPHPTVEHRSTSHRRQLSGSDVSQRPQQQSSRPPSIASSSSRPVSLHRATVNLNQVPMMPYPMMPIAPQMPPVPPIAPMPIWNMPLLPPNAPFMMQQYSRSPSPGSSPHSRDHSPSGSSARRLSDVLPPSPSRRQSNLYSSSSSSPSRRQNSGQNISGPSHSHHSGDNNQSQPLSERRKSNSASQRPSRSASHSALQQAVPQPIHRDDKSQRSRHVPSTNSANTDPKRRT